MTQTIQRREEIVRLVRQNPIHSQEELQALLGKVGIRVTQPTLSRDLKDLGMAKTPSGYIVPTDLNAFTSTEQRAGKLEQLVREFVHTISRSGTLVIVKTPPAAAQPVAHAIDASAFPEVVGTIGGDDTIFLAARSNTAATSLARRLSGYLEPPHSPSRTRA